MEFKRYIKKEMSSKKTPQQRDDKQTVPRERNVKSAPSRNKDGSEGSIRSGKERRTLSVKTTSPRKEYKEIEKSSTTSQSKETVLSEKPSSSEKMDFLLNLDKLEFSCKLNGNQRENDGDNEIFISRYDSVKKLKDMKTKLLENIYHIDNKVSNMLYMRNNLKSISSLMKGFSLAAFKLKRNNQGVPYFSAVKELVRHLYDEFNTSANQEKIHQIVESRVPFVESLIAQLKSFCLVCERIILTIVNYNVTYLEDFHLVTGKIYGLAETIISLYYGDEEEPTEAVENIEDTIVKNSTFLEENKADERNEKVSAASLKELERLGNILAKSNRCLGNIARLSLGNPKNQSLSDSFAKIISILAQVEEVFGKLEELKLPCVEMLRQVVSRSSLIAQDKKPGEKQVEEIKFSFGECDGQILILAKYLTIEK